MPVLIVDDDASCNLLISVVCKSLGLTPEAHTDAPEALERLLQEPYDLLVVDYMMPDLDGASLVRRVRAVERYRHLPIIAVTARAGFQSREALLAAGVNAIVEKPFSVNELARMIEKLLSMRPGLPDAGGRPFPQQS